MDGNLLSEPKYRTKAPSWGSCSEPQTESKICAACGFLATQQQWKDSYETCPKCDFHDTLEFSQRVHLLCDEILKPLGSEISPKDPLSFEDHQPYALRLEKAQTKTKKKEALSIFLGRLGSYRAIYAIFDFDFIGGSMSSAVGDLFIEAVFEAINHQVPLICQAISGGARMQEGVYSLMQMKRTAAALAELDKARLPYIVLLASPCMGGVSASFASLGDLHLAEPGALIGFSGPRVIAQTVGRTLPEGFQRAEFIQEKGFIDSIVARSEIRKTLTRWLKKFSLVRDYVF